MNLNEIERNARALMTAHGVGSLAFEFDRGKKRIGATHFVRTNGVVLPIKITLSRYFAELLQAEEIRETILHEIAHAKAGYGAGHGPVWKREAKALGIPANACKAASARPEYSVKPHCATCDRVLDSGMHRLPLKLYACAKCRTTLTWQKNGRTLDLHEMPVRYQQAYERKYGNVFSH